MSSVILEARNIDKDFVVARSLGRQLLNPFGARKVIQALSAVTFRIKSGEILAVVGPNGAGKTTLLRILADLLEPDRGWVKLCGHKLNGRGHCLRNKIGYVSSDERSFFWRLTGKQNLQFFARLYGIPGLEARRTITAMLKVFGVEEKASQLFRDYSTGTRKKFALIRALLHQPSILLLDEVTNSLDPPSAKSVKSLVREYVSGRSGCAGVWSTHRLEEIDEICDKVLVINKGRVKFFGSVSGLKSKGDRKTDYLKDGNLNGQAGHSLNTVFANSY